MAVRNHGQDEQTIPIVTRGRRGRNCPVRAARKTTPATPAGHRPFPEPPMPQPLVHHYHLFVPPGGEPLAAAIWREHLAALAASGLGRRLAWMETCVVGGEIPLPPPPCPHTVVRFPGGHEMRTLDRLRTDAETRDPDACYLYCHSKGVTHGTRSADAVLNTHWRRAMLGHVVHGWRDAVAPLVAGRCDVAGPFYLEPAAWQARHPAFGGTPYFAGNFWWATAAHVRRLPRLPVDGNRYLAEIWIGLAPHRAFSRTRNVWPNASRCRRARLAHAIRNRLRPGPDV